MKKKKQRQNTCLCCCRVIVQCANGTQGKHDKSPKCGEKKRGCVSSLSFRGENSASVLEEHLLWFCWSFLVSAWADGLSTESLSMCCWCPPPSPHPRSEDHHLTGSSSRRTTAESSGWTQYKHTWIRTWDWICRPRSPTSTVTLPRRRRVPSDWTTSGAAHRWSLDQSQTDWFSVM